MLRRGFNRIASIYELLGAIAFLGNLRRAQSILLGRVPSNARVLVVGGGTGWFLLKMIKVCQPASIVWIDISDKMINKARKKLVKKAPDFKDRVEFIRKDVFEYASDLEFDVVVTHFLLDVFEQKQAEDLAYHLFQHLKKEGTWSFVDFYIPESGVSGFLGRIQVWWLYLFFRLYCRIPGKKLPDFGKVFGPLKMEMVEEKKRWVGTIRSVIYKKKG